MNDFLAIPAAMGAFSAANHAAGETITAAGSANSEAMLAAAFAAIGPFGATTFFPAFAPAVCNNLAATLLLGQVHDAIGGATSAASAAIVASDNA